MLRFSVLEAFSGSGAGRVDCTRTRVDTGTSLEVPPMVPSGKVE